MPKNAKVKKYESKKRNVKQPQKIKNETKEKTTIRFPPK